MNGFGCEIVCWSILTVSSLHSFHTNQFASAHMIFDPNRILSAQNQTCYSGLGLHIFFVYRDECKVAMLQVVGAADDFKGECIVTFNPQKSQCVFYVEFEHWNLEVIGEH